MRMRTLIVLLGGVVAFALSVGCRATGSDGDVDGDADGDDIVPCDGGWFDADSGLCWQDPPPEDRIFFASAVTYCDALNLGGHGPGSWHLPTISELRSLIRGCPATMTGGECPVTDSCSPDDRGSECQDDTCGGCEPFGGPGAGGAYWPELFNGAIERWYWSSTSDGEGYGIYVWDVVFVTGDISASEEEMNAGYVRCVRAGP